MPAGYVFKGNSTDEKGTGDSIEGKSFRDLIAANLLGELEGLDDNSVPLKLYAQIAKKPEDSGDKDKPDKPGSDDQNDDSNDPNGRSRFAAHTTVNSAYINIGLAVSEQHSLFKLLI